MPFLKERAACGGFFIAANRKRRAQKIKNQDLIRRWILVFLAFRVKESLLTLPLVFLKGTNRRRSPPAFRKRGIPAFCVEFPWQPPVPASRTDSRAGFLHTVPQLSAMFRALCEMCDRSPRQSEREGTADAALVVFDRDLPAVNVHDSLDEGESETVTLPAV